MKPPASDGELADVILIVNGDPDLPE